MVDDRCIHRLGITVVCHDGMTTHASTLTNHPAPSSPVVATFIWSRRVRPRSCNIAGMSLV